jgi:hypothetical protein
MKWLKQIKEYWFLIVFIFGGVAAISSLVVGGYVSEIADDNLHSDASKAYIVGLIDDKLEDSVVITTMDGTLILHDSKIKGNTQNIVVTQDQLRDVIQILMSD